MEHSCAKCNMETGMSVRLSEDSKRGEFVCSLNPKHRFKMGKSGFLEPVEVR